MHQMREKSYFCRLGHFYFSTMSISPVTWSDIYWNNIFTQNIIELGPHSIRGTKNILYYTFNRIDSVYILKDFVIDVWLQVQVIYCISKKFCPISSGNLPYKMGQDFLD